MAHEPRPAPPIRDCRTLAAYAECTVHDIEQWYLEGLTVNGRQERLARLDIESLLRFVNHCVGHPEIRSKVRSAVVDQAIQGPIVDHVSAFPSKVSQVVASLLLVACSVAVANPGAASTEESTMGNSAAVLKPSAVQIPPDIAQQIRLTSHRAVALATPSVAAKEGWAEIFKVTESSIQKWCKSRYDGGRINIFDKLMRAMDLSHRLGAPMDDAYAGITWQAQRIGRGLRPLGAAVRTDDLMESFAEMQARAATLNARLGKAVSENSPGGRHVLIGEARELVSDLRALLSEAINFEFSIVAAAERGEAAYR